MKAHSRLYATVILPLAVPKTYSYLVPTDLEEDMRFGIRVEVPLRNKLYAAIVVSIDRDLDLVYKARELVSVIDVEPIISELQYRFWKWIADYYCCTIGEVMGVALPGGLKLASETKVVISPDYDGDVTDLNEHEFLIAEALAQQQELSISAIQEITDRKTVYPYIRTLLDKKAIYIKEELKQKYKPKKADYVALTAEYNSSADDLTKALDLVTRSDHQTRAVLAFHQLRKGDGPIAKSAIVEAASVTGSVIKAIEKKGIWTIERKIVSRLDLANSDHQDDSPMSDQQKAAYDFITDPAGGKKPVLLHGVTGSGKTRVYVELIKAAIDRGDQVLYLVPEIALTTQIVQRVQAALGTKVQVYHSRMGDNERVELWNATYQGLPVVLGARSSLFLPYQKLGLIIVDEEHDSSYKQQDPAPRYNARDAAAYLAALTKAQMVVGSATPSLESYYNARSGKYRYFAMPDRYGKATLPTVEVVDLRKAYRSNAMKGMISLDLYRAIEGALEKQEQVLLFQNRRGYSTSIQCTVCGWVAECPNCDLSLTLHQFLEELKCHSCGHRAKNPKECPACGSDEITKVGFGTEKIEDQIKELFPTASVRRMDYDTVRTKNQFRDLIHDFETQKVDIMVGTQMITKGLDFEKVTVVGVLHADRILHFPDIRASERGFQLLTQVAGRAGRSTRPGTVFIQTFQPDHPVIQETIMGAYVDFAIREGNERQQHTYPPFFRMIHIQLRHKKRQIVEDAARSMAVDLRKRLGNRILGPAEPGVARLRNYYLQNIIIKFEKDPQQATFVKKYLLTVKSNLSNTKAYKSVRIVIDVDPY